jgi:hypothetical protein
MRAADLIVLAFIATGFVLLVAGVVQTVTTSPATVPALLTGFVVGLLAAVIHRSISYHHNEGGAP